MGKGVVALLLLALAQGQALAEVYRWVDESGRVHFTDRPPPGKGERMEISTPRLSSPDRPPPGTLVPDRQRLLDMYDKQRQEKRAARAEQARREAERERECLKVQQALRRYLSGGVIYRNGAQGRDYLSAAEKDAEVAQMRALLDEHCGGTPQDLRPRSGR